MYQDNNFEKEKKSNNEYGYIYQAEDYNNYNSMLYNFGDDANDRLSNSVYGINANNISRRLEHGEDLDGSGPNMVANNAEVLLNSKEFNDAVDEISTDVINNLAESIRDSLSIDNNELKEEVANRLVEEIINNQDFLDQENLIDQEVRINVERAARGSVFLKKTVESKDFSVFDEMDHQSKIKCLECCSQIIDKNGSSDSTPNSELTPLGKLLEEVQGQSEESEESESKMSQADDFEEAQEIINEESEDSQASGDDDSINTIEELKSDKQNSQINDIRADIDSLYNDNSYQEIFTSNSTDISNNKAALKNSRDVNV